MANSVTGISLMISEPAPTAATHTSEPSKVLREQEFEGSDRLRSPSDLIGPVRRNLWALEIRFAPDAASNVLNFLNLLFTSWIFDS
jgi:hypothetical protein